MTEVRVLSDDDVASSLSLAALPPDVERAFVKRGRGEVERPPRPHYHVGTETPGTALAVPAYVRGDPTYATKLAAVHEGNREREIPTVNAQLALTDAERGLRRRRDALSSTPRASFAGRLISRRRGGRGWRSSEHSDRFSPSSSPSASRWP